MICYKWFVINIHAQYETILIQHTSTCRPGQENCTNTHTFTTGAVSHSINVRGSSGGSLKWTQNLTCCTKRLARGTWTNIQNTLQHKIMIMLECIWKIHYSPLLLFEPLVDIGLMRFFLSFCELSRRNAWNNGDNQSNACMFACSCTLFPLFDAITSTIWHYHTSTS